MRTDFRVQFTHKSAERMPHFWGTKFTESLYPSRAMTLIPFLLSSSIYTLEYEEM